MMKVDFYYENDELVCKIIEEDTEIIKRCIDARIILRKLDNEDFENVQISNKNISLKNDSMKIYIHNIDKFYYDGHFNVLKRTLPKIEKALAKYQRDKFKNNIVKNVKKYKYYVVAGCLILAILSGTAAFSKFKDNNNNNDNDYDIEGEEIPDDVFDDDKNRDLDGDFLTMIDELGDDIAYIDFEIQRNSEKAQYVYDTYSEIAAEYSQKWGISENTIISMLTQESGGKETNLMQIQFWSWEDEPIRVYNFRDECYEVFVLTKSPEKYVGQDIKGAKIVCITPQDLENPKTNISIGCVLLRKAAEGMKYHVGASIQCYNFGYNNMMKVLNKTSEETGKSVDEILSIQDNLDFMKYTYIIDEGDKDYLNHVVRYADEGSEFEIKYLSSGKVQENNVTIYPTSSKTF